MICRYEHVCLEALAHRLPEEIVTSEEIERRLEPLYRRLRLPAGRLELMSGIHERRLWPEGMLPSTKSIETAREAIRRSGLAKEHFGALVHGSVSRDYLEPATASAVHHGLGLPPSAIVYDVSNACLGLLNGVVQIANMIELGQIGAGLVVGTETSRGLLEATIRQLNGEESLSRADIKTALASLTIGSGSAAVVLAHRTLSRHGHRLLGGVGSAATEFCHLCRGGYGELADAEGEPLMATDSEALLREGVVAAKAAFDELLVAMDWRKDEISRTFCHQVGKAHRKLLLETLGLDPAIDLATFPWLGNTGSVALPMTASIAIDEGQVQPGDRVALLGIGSGIHVLMLGVQWAG